MGGLFIKDVCFQMVPAKFNIFVRRERVGESIEIRKKQASFMDSPWGLFTYNVPLSFSISDTSSPPRHAKMASQISI